MVAPVNTSRLPLTTPKTAPAAIVSRKAGSIKSTTPIYAARKASGAHTPSVCTHVEKPGKYGVAS